jgi:glycosyltransferase involved in cell wall biosynthesis
MINYSIIVPVHNRPGEIKELLDSLSNQRFKDFETIVIDDGSTLKADCIVRAFKGKIDVVHYYKDSSGPGLTRNFGCSRARGDYFIILDSDCIVPENYLENVNNYLSRNHLDVFGGPERPHPSFTSIQRAITYSMTSFLTTGGIRGGKRHIGKFHPRSFNMGMSKEVFRRTQGFSSMRYGEDVEFSVRTIASGFKTGLIDEAFVYHKRRTSIVQFFDQVFHSGSARIEIFKLHRAELKLVHLFPAAFTTYSLATLFAALVDVKTHLLLGSLLMIYFMLILIDSTIRNRSLKIGFLSIIASFVQLIGYGVGFVSAFFRNRVLKKQMPQEQA